MQRARVWRRRPRRDSTMLEIVLLPACSRRLSSLPALNCARGGQAEATGAAHNGPRLEICSSSAQVPGSLSLIASCLPGACKCPATAPSSNPNSNRARMTGGAANGAGRAAHAGPGQGHSTSRSSRARESGAKACSPSAFRHDPRRPWLPTACANPQTSRCDINGCSTQTDTPHTRPAERRGER